MRIDGALDFEKARVVAAPKGLLPIGLVDVGLREIEDQPCTRSSPKGLGVGRTHLVHISPHVQRQLTERFHVDVCEQVRLDLLCGGV